MNKVNEYERRAQEVADTLRRFLIAIHTGGIGVILAVAGALTDQKVNPKWAFWPVLIFISGLVIIGVSLLLAKHREVKRSEAEKEGKQEPNFSGFFWRSYTWDTFSLILFVVASVVGLWLLSKVNIQS